MKLLVAFLLSIVPLCAIQAQSQSKSLFVGKVDNKVVVGPLAGNSKLTFGVKNILEELVSENYSLSSSREEADYSLDVEVIYLDVEQVNSNISVFHKDENSVIITLKGQLLQKGKVLRTKTATEKSSEISMSTLMISEAGGFNQQSLRNALKKASVSLVTKLLDKL
jgi:hypothetical protein